MPPDHRPTAQPEIDGKVAGPWRTLIEYAIRAPSSHNSQPWRFVIAGDRLELHADRARSLSVVDPNGRELAISCGGALGHIGVAARALGWSLLIEHLPDDVAPTLLARLSLRGRRDAELEDASRLAALPYRRTNRRQFHADLPRLHELECELFRPAADGVRTEVVTRDARQRLVELISEGTRRQMRDPAFRRELASWLRPKASPRGDGLPGAVLGLGWLSSLIAPRLLPHFDLGSAIARRDALLAGRAPLLVVLTTDRDAPERWLATGARLACGLLDLRRVGLWASYFNQPVQVPELRAKLRQLLDIDAHPQLVLRIGYGPTPPPTPRRALEDVLSSAAPRAIASEAETTGATEP